MLCLLHRLLLPWLTHRCCKCRPRPRRRRRLCRLSRLCCRFRRLIRFRRRCLRRMIGFLLQQLCFYGGRFRLLEGYFRR